jgi:hypothetical protein
MATHVAYGTTKSRPVRSFAFLEQLQDLLANTDIFEKLERLSINRKESERFTIFRSGEDDKFSKVVAVEWASRTSIEFISTDDNGDAIVIPINLFETKLERMHFNATV